ncbi:5331_t:CDS:2 [Dentiscutata heterogama]|uniref:5331_t:CDS:1 n=1 Tax=Dentiscutata heterogama TaxID=1316150 RepID=A0ACA9M310_9GLOM|nr:5331_t:CDS:2 [Dentiscutata heterogama]
MDDDTEDNDVYTFELMRNIEKEIENEVRDLTDQNSDKDKIFDKTEENTDDEAEEETNLVEESLEMGQNLHTQKKIAMIQSGLQEDQDLQRSFYVTKKFDLPIE